MKFSSAADKLGIVQDIDWLVDSDDTAYPVAHKTRNVNAWLDRVASLILQSDGKWEWEDTNQTDLPIGTTTLTSGQQDYSIDTTYLKVRAVAVKDSAGTLHYLNRLDEKSPQAGTQELMDSSKSSGTPTGYAFVGNSIVLDKKPNYTASGGLKVYFQRNVVYFEDTDTTAVPGFAPMFHRVLSFGAALDYAIKHDYAPTKIANLQNRIKELEASLMEFYSSRDQDMKIGMSLQSEDYGANGELTNSKQFNLS
jgi:hypothetical protein